MPSQPATQAQPPRCGLTLPEVLAGTIVLSILLPLLLLPALGRRTNCGSYYVKCRSQLKQVESAWALFAMGSNERYPNPLLYSRKTALASKQPGNSTANIHAMMIFENFYSPELVYCPSEASGFVQEAVDYDYGGRNSKLPVDFKWDPDFDADITGFNGAVSNVSYANLNWYSVRYHVNPNRLKRNGASSQKRTSPLVTPILADRGPEFGENNPNSASYMTHGSRKWWAGNIVFADGHSIGSEEAREELLGFVPPDLVFGANKTPDNIFSLDDPEKYTDTWLGIFTATKDDPNTLIPLYD